ncbi:hypothetical protein CPT_Moonbeam146 [Bacillus phage Moonbeam]|uniref:Uncharacterized protein n=1 Tax=Bacillus phage Moonbeam TaxID=1540091 RepID=A0A0A0RPK7_9CAUD|nr:hypothetical protein CPT_Moonbeam146 [Bacillus phage Moonbeam]AIW03544.1 hypothetical protein CPT_Moonbeam146 [Bacillus phage Moonbeam]
MSLWIPDITYIREVLSVEPEEGSWALIHPDKEYVRVKMVAAEWYQEDETISKVFEKKKWEQIQEHGTFGKDVHWKMKEEK